MVQRGELGFRERAVPERDLIMKNSMTRRAAMGRLTSGAMAMAATASLAERLSAAESVGGGGLKGRVNHSVCKWCYERIPLEDFCQSAREIGLQSVELLETKQFPTLKMHDLACAMVSGVPGGITSGLNRMENHEGILRFFEETTPVVAEHGFPNIICFSGNRAGMSDDQGLENCAAGLKRVMPIAEKHKVTVCMELLNSKRTHKDYMCDHTAWGVELVKRVGSERFKLLYDIFHMQIMEGDVCDTIRENHVYIGHYHTGGVPGRGEIDDTQELHYPAVMNAILATGYKGFVAQEFVPKRSDAIASLRQGVKICDV
jgi:hydroxypyruvate isomerase